jgi:hypothetical protein
MDPESILLGKQVEQDDEAVKARNAFRRKYKSENPNCYLEKENKTVFEKILRTPNSANDIKWCIKHGADLYAVSFDKS